MMQAPPPETIVRETLPLGAQWGLLGVLLFLALVAIVYLVIRQFRMADEHKAELLAMANKASADVAAVQEKRLREAADYAGVLAELGEVMAGNTGDLQDGAKLLQSAITTLGEMLADQAEPPRPRTRGGSRPT